MASASGAGWERSGRQPHRTTATRQRRDGGSGSGARGRPARDAGARAAGTGATAVAGSNGDANGGRGDGGGDGGGGRAEQLQMEEPMGMVVVRGQEGLDAVQISNRLTTLCLARLGERNTWEIERLRETSLSRRERKRGNRR
jgi:hypothetical protein